MSERISHHHKECALLRGSVPNLIDHDHVGEMCHGPDGKPIERRVAKAEQRVLESICKFNRREFRDNYRHETPLCVDERQRQRRGASQVGYRCVGCKSEFASLPDNCPKCGLRSSWFAEFPAPSSVESAAPKPTASLAGGSSSFTMPCGCFGKVNYCNQHNSQTALSAASKFYEQGQRADKLVEALRAIANCQTKRGIEYVPESGEVMKRIAEQALALASLDGNAKGEV